MVSLDLKLKNLERLTGSSMANTRRMNRLEELGRVDAEKAFTKKGARNLKDEKKRIVRELKADGGKVKRRPAPRPKTGRPQTPRDEQRKRKMSPFNLPKGLTLIEVKKDGGKVLKKVKPSQKGLKKLPTKVRNKMGYMKKGGRVGMGKAMRGGGCVR